MVARQPFEFHNGQSTSKTAAVSMVNAQRVGESGAVEAQLRSPRLTAGWM